MRFKETLRGTVPNSQNPAPGVGVDKLVDRNKLPQLLAAQFPKDANLEVVPPVAITSKVGVPKL